MHRSLIALATALALAPSASALDILVTNDDGIASAGLQTLATALADAGHDVTVVAPATQQSGKGGSVNTDVFGDFVTIVRTGDDQYSVEGTPSDAVNAALNLILEDPPDLVVSGLNEGQNLGKPTSNVSGTIGAALSAALGAGIPAIAGSVGILFSESGDDFPSTIAAYPSAADFIVRVIERLEYVDGLLPHRVRLLNINFPVPAEGTQGVKITRLADGSDLTLPFFDVTNGFPPFFPPLPIADPCDSIAVGGFCLAGVGVTFPPGPDPVQRNDVDAHRDGFITITPMSGDMTADPFASFVTAWLLKGLTP
ncbi:MAG: 5'/3'-nucleotidase SurE [Myxococcota bacterium]